MIKEKIRRLLARRGWFLRKMAGLPAGVDFERDWTALAGLPAPRVIFDVGGHRGETCERFALGYPMARIHSFEPVAANFSVLQEQARRFPSVVCHPFAFGCKSEQVTIELQPDSQTHSLRHRASSASPQTETIIVKTIDEFCSVEKIPRIDLLKIDTEGHELAVLTGAHVLLERHAIGPILLEASLDPDDHEHTQLVALTAHLKPYGYFLAGLYEQVMWRDPVRLAYFNALFVPRSAPAP